MDVFSRCSLCDALLSPDNDYVVRIDLFADPRTPPMNTEGAGLSHAGVSDLIDQMKLMSEMELMDGVHQRFEFHVCARCRHDVAANPLGLPRRTKQSEN